MEVQVRLLNCICTHSSKLSDWKVSVFVGKKTTATRLHYILKTWQCLVPVEHFSLTLQVYFRASKSRIGGKAFSFQALLLCNQLQFGFRRQTASLLLKLGWKLYLKLIFWSNLDQMEGSGDLKASISDASLRLFRDFPWCAQHFSPPPLFTPCVFMRHHCMSLTRVFFPMQFVFVLILSILSFFPLLFYLFSLIF